MAQLTEVQRGQAMIMQGQRQIVVARHFRVHVCTRERRVRRLRETGRVTDRPRSGRDGITSENMRNQKIAATESARYTIGTHNHPVHA